MDFLQGMHYETGVRTLSFFVCVAFSSLSAWAGSVVVTGDFFDLSRINHFYQSLGDSSVVSNSPLDTIDLSGVDLLWSVQPAAAYTGAELLSLHHFLEAGGRIAFMGEHGFYRPSENLRIDAAISSLGGHITIENLAPDADFRVASKTNGQIVVNPLTDGVDRFEYACFAPLRISAGAQALMRGQDDPTDIMMAYETIGAGSIFVVADENGWDHEAEGWPSGANNARLFANLLAVGLPGSAVPEPSSYGWISVAGLLGLIGWRRWAILRSGKLVTDER